MRQLIRAGLMWLACLLLLHQTSIAQNKISDIPPFRLMQTGGRMIGPSALAPGKPVVLIYFAPDCGHCTTLLDGVFKEMTAFKNATLLLATFKPVGELQTFERMYKTAAHPNIITGTEGTTFFLRNYYKMQRTPFVAIFDKKGKQVRTFEKDPLVKDLISGLRTL